MLYSEYLQPRPALVFVVNSRCLVLCLLANFAPQPHYEILTQWQRLTNSRLSLKLLDYLVQPVLHWDNLRGHTLLKGPQLFGQKYLHRRKQVPRWDKHTRLWAALGFPEDMAKTASTASQSEAQLAMARGWHLRNLEVHAHSVVEARIQCWRGPFKLR